MLFFLVINVKMPAAGRGVGGSESVNDSLQQYFSLYHDASQLIE